MRRLNSLRIIIVRLDGFENQVLLKKTKYISLNGNKIIYSIDDKIQFVRLINISLVCVLRSILNLQTPILSSLFLYRFKAVINI